MEHQTTHHHDDVRTLLCNFFQVYFISSRSLQRTVKQASDVTHILVLYASFVSRFCIVELCPLRSDCGSVRRGPRLPVESSEKNAPCAFSSNKQRCDLCITLDGFLIDFCVQIDREYLSHRIGLIRAKHFHLQCNRWKCSQVSRTRRTDLPLMIRPANSRRRPSLSTVAHPISIQAPISHRE